ncbi:bifunctional phosphopantothenoylcysteine decarboxylase/phosphopantothenate--cysteine ligase CoaBC [Methanocaldococcus indicus]|uniref:bifunctional phosphopantothenoylcysteine decarboxylase/phosphopantothenate--cysteine ligase CoaBC n=1 Tax=Methanocaldococcus indicus TaxID=213231 RepID=UPI003C6CEE2B
MLDVKSCYLKDKKIVVAVSSSISAIESIKLMRELKRHGAYIYCIATKEALNIVGEKALKFASDEFYVDIEKAEHVYLYENADLLVIYPATANTISKINLKIADNILTTTALMFLNYKPTIIVPAMHINMLKNIETHLNELKKNENLYIIKPKIEEGKAKIADYKEVVKKCIDVIGVKPKKSVLVINGATAEFIDNVRIITNLSSGKFGKAIAEEFSKEFYVEVVQGLGDYPYYLKVHKVLTVNEMLNKSLELAKDFDAIIVPAAISDFIPEKMEGKISSDKDNIILKLKRAPKVLEELRKKYKNKIIVGFKAEYNISKDELIRRAKERLKKYKLNMIVANDLSKYYFGSDVVECYLITNNDIIKVCGSKKEVAKEIVEKVKEMIP